MAQETSKAKRASAARQPRSSANWRNRSLFHGDNLPFLKGMNSESVDLIATDPPFNKGRDFHATPNSLSAGSKFQDRWSWKRDARQEWIDQIKDDCPRAMVAIEVARSTHSDGMGAFLCFMAARLLEMRRVLKPSGSIYMHCDPTASHYLKAVMDAIFGWRSFQNEIVWHYRKWTNAASHFQRNHDVILFYTAGKSDAKATFNEIMVDPAEGQAAAIDKGHCAGAAQTPSGESKPQPLGCSQRAADKLVRDGKPDMSKHGAVVGRDGQAKPEATDVWKMQFLHSQSKERVGYPTQKPVQLYERIINASSNKGDIVLDPFAGSATTLVAAERLGRQWVGIDLWDNSRAVVLKRLGQEGLVSEGEEKTSLLDKEVHFTSEPPTRTDEKEALGLVPCAIKGMKEPRGVKWSRAEMRKYLLKRHGSRCQGCDRTFDDPRYLELDHNTPRSDGGLNHVSNRILLCGPCNKVKSNQYTLSGLRRRNQKEGWMAKEPH